MKRLIIFSTLIAAIFMVSTPAQADPYINLISHSVKTDGMITNPDPDHLFSWDESGATSISVSLPPFGILGSASADISRSTAVLDAEVPVTSRWPVSANSLAEILFQPIEASSLKISASVYSTGVAFPGVALIDETTSVSLLRFSKSSLFVYGEDVSEKYDIDFLGFHNEFQGILLPVDPSHIYLLSTGVSVASDFGGALASISLAVPEPITMLLLGSGLVGLCAVRRKVNN